MTHVLVPVGTRPEIIKLAPVVNELRAAGMRVTTLGTGQHFTPELSSDIYTDLGWRPDLRWELTAPLPERVGELTARASSLLASLRPDLVLALGDTSTVPAFGLAARATRIPFVHIEAGLRSFNQTSIEEVNRKVGAVCASVHFAPTRLAEEFLLAEGIEASRIHVVGNPVIDAVQAMGIRPTAPALRRGVVVTAHRATNVDVPDRLAKIVEIVRGCASAVGPVLFPAHPRTRERLAALGYAAGLGPGVSVVDPLPYRRMLEELARCQLVVTDSGGIQEEALYLGVPAVVLRTSTPRWEGVELGAVELVGLDPAAALDAAVRLSSPEQVRRVAALDCPYGDGTAGRQIARILTSLVGTSALELTEPDLRGGPPGSR